MKVVSILEIESQRASRKYSDLRAAGGKREPFLAAMTAAGTTINTGLALFLQRELDIDCASEPSILDEAVVDGLIRARREWFAAARAGLQVSEDFTELAAASGKGTYESALAAQSAARWHSAAYAAARAGQIATYWRKQIEAPQHEEMLAVA
jgi:hypothetical protein